jgi:hypothetical protein
MTYDEKSYFYGCLSKIRDNSMKFYEISNDTGYDVVGKQIYYSTTEEQSMFFLLDMGKFLS